MRAIDHLLTLASSKGEKIVGPFRSVFLSIIIGAFLGFSAGAGF